MISKKEIQAGVESTNIQDSEHVTVSNTHNYGLSYSVVKDVAMDVFKSNFYDLGEKVESLINVRAEEIINKYLNRLEKESPESIINTDNPDVRFAIYEVQKSYARLGDIEISELLVEALIQRTMNKEETFEKLVLNEALSIIPKLTSKQIDVLSLIHLVRYLNYVPEFKVPVEQYKSTIEPFYERIEVSKNEMIYQHLQYSGCLSISIGSAKFDTIMVSKFPHLFTENDDLIPLLQSNKKLSEIKEIWDNTSLCSCSLTSVGIAIALINLRVKMGYNWDLNIWVNEN